MIIPSMICLLLAAQPGPLCYSIQTSNSKSEPPFFDYREYFPNIQIKAKSVSGFRLEAIKRGLHRYKAISVDAGSFYILSYDSGSFFIKSYCYVFEETKNGFLQRMSAELDGPIEIRWNRALSQIEFARRSLREKKLEAPSIVFRVMKHHL